MPTHIPRLFGDQTAMVADLYHLTMAYGFWKKGLSERESVFHLFYRKPPFQNGYVLAAGLALVVDYLQRFRFDAGDVAYLGRLTGSDGAPLFSESFLNYLQRLRFSCDLDAFPEGTVALPHQPLLRVRGPLAQATLIESALLNLINFSSLIATKGARIVQAANGDTVLEFGLRRAQGLDGALTAGRAAYIGGCHATSNLLAGRWYDIPVKGTHAHSWVMCFDTEQEAFAAYAEVMPHNCILLVDTYDTLEGVRKAIAVGHRLRKKGYVLNGIRLDSGDLARLARAARKMLDEAGLTDTRIVASNSLDEDRIRELKKAGAPIDIWGVGTRLITAQNDPALGGVYKISALENANGILEGKIKLSEEASKTSNPGVLDVRRYSRSDGQPVADMLFDVQSDAGDELVPFGSEKRLALSDLSYQTLLEPIFRRGDLVYTPPSLSDIRQYCLDQQARFTSVDWRDYPNGLERTLHQKKLRMVAGIRKIQDPQK